VFALVTIFDLLLSEKVEAGDAFRTFEAGLSFAVVDA
jgi:hypothetical protein